MQEDYDKKFEEILKNSNLDIEGGEEVDFDFSDIMDLLKNLSTASIMTLELMDDLFKDGVVFTQEFIDTLKGLNIVACQYIDLIDDECECEECSNYEEEEVEEDE